MKKLLILLALAFAGCQKNDLPEPAKTPVVEVPPPPNPNTPPCTINLNLFKDVLWRNVIDSLPTIQFLSNGTWYRDGVYVFTWEPKPACGLIGSGGFYYLITSVTTDSLHLYVPALLPLQVYYK